MVGFNAMNCFRNISSIWLMDVVGFSRTNNLALTSEELKEIGLSWLPGHPAKIVRLDFVIHDVMNSHSAVRSREVILSAISENMF